jgi:hypothetical protein
MSHYHSGPDCGFPQGDLRLQPIAMSCVPAACACLRHDFREPGKGHSFRSGKLASAPTVLSMQSQPVSPLSTRRRSPIPSAL